MSGGEIMDENNYVEAEVVEKKNNSKAITGFVTGLVGFLCCFPVGIVGLIFSIIALKEMKESGNEQGKGLAIAGVILASIGILWQIIAWIGYGAVMINILNDPSYLAY